MPGNPLCPVQSFKSYLFLLNHKETAFFQYPNKKLNGFNNAPIGKNSLGVMMKEISTSTNLSKSYKNHCIRKTTATAIKKQGFDLNEISHITKYKNLDSLKHYIGGPTYSDKRKYNDTMSNCASGNDEPQPKIPVSPFEKNTNATPKTPENTTANKILHAQEAPIMENSPQVQSDQCLVTMYLDSEDSSTTDMSYAPLKSKQNVINQLRNTSHLFQNANFTNCNFTFQMPK